MPDHRPKSGSPPFPDLGVCSRRRLYRRLMHAPGSRTTLTMDRGLESVYYLSQRR